MTLKLILCKITIALATFQIIFFRVIVQGKGGKQALIIGRFHQSIIYLPNVIPDHTEIGAVAIACPAESTAEENFTKKFAFEKNALFLRKIYPKGSKISQLEKNACKYPLQISLVYNVKSDNFLVGFEIYFRLRDEEFVMSSNYADYKSCRREVISTILSREMKKVRQVGRLLAQVVKNEIDDVDEELWFDDDRRLGFMWASLVKIKFNFSAKILKYITYDIDANSKWPVHKEDCENYELGWEVYENIDIDIIYDQGENEFAYKLPSDLDCRSNRKCFKKWLLIPMDRFHYGFSKPICSDMATIPIWATDPELEFILKKLDQYLYTLSQFFFEPLHIITGTIGEHQVFTKNNDKQKSTMYLSSQRNIIPIPKIIYKIVEHRLKNCQKEEKFCWYSAVIVIHNDPFFNPNMGRLCSEKITDLWGWREITIGSESQERQNFIYVCPKDNNIMGKLFGLNSREVQVTSGELNLTRIPFSSILSDIGSQVETTFHNYENNGKIRANVEIHSQLRRYDNPENSSWLS